MVVLMLALLPTGCSRSYQVYCVNKLKREVTVEFNNLVVFQDVKPSDTTTVSKDMYMTGTVRVKVLLRNKRVIESAEVERSKLEHGFEMSSVSLRIH
jgi:hypothetical protein